MYLVEDLHRSPGLETARPGQIAVPDVAPGEGLPFLPAVGADFGPRRQAGAVS